MHRTLVAIHGLLVRLLLPPAFRMEFADELELTVKARVEAASGFARSGIATLEILDLLRTATREWYRAAAHSLGGCGAGASLDLRTAVRSLARSWRSTGLAIATLSLGIGASTAVYSVLEGVLLQPLSYPEADRIVRVAIGARPESGTTEGPFSPRGFRHLLENTRVFDAVGAAGVVQRPLSGDGPAIAVDVALVTRGALVVIGIEPRVGRLPSPAEDLPGGTAVTLISHALWQDRYGSDPSVIGRSITLGPEDHEVIGVMPQGYDFPSPGTDAWVLRRLDPASDDFRAHFLTVFARLSDGVTITDAEADTERIIAGFSAIGYGPEWFEEIFTGEAVVRPLRDDIVGTAREPILIAFGTVALLLAVAYTSVASLLLVRAESRREERALRRALGAGRLQLVRYTLVESGLLSSTGAVLGIALAAVGTHVLIAAGPETIPRLREVQLNSNVLLFAMCLAVGGALAFGLMASAWGRSDGQRLPAVGRGTVGRSGPSRIQNALSIGQVALAVMLLTAAGLMIRTFSELRGIDPGFQAENVLAFRLTPSPAKYPNPEASARFYDQLLDDIRDVPGVSAAGAITHLPLSGGGGVRGATLEESSGVGFFVRRATPGYFEALGIPIIEGRTFAAEDNEDRLGSVIISESIKHEFWPDESALGKRIETWGAPATVVGVVGDVHQVDLRSAAGSAIYKPLLDSVGGGGLSLAVVVRSAGDPVERLEALRGIVAALDPDLPLADVQTLETLVEDDLSRTTFTMTLITVAAAIALFLAAAGLYAVLSYVVSRRKTELAVRMAIGAERSEVLARVLFHGLRLALIGLVLGLAGSTLLGGVLGSLLAEVPPVDIATLVGVTTILLLASLAASLAPALRSRNTPLADILREDG